MSAASVPSSPYGPSPPLSAEALFSSSAFFSLPSSSHREAHLAHLHHHTQSMLRTLLCSVEISRSTIPSSSPPPFTWSTLHGSPFALVCLLQELVTPMNFAEHTEIMERGVAAPSGIPFSRTAAASHTTGQDAAHVKHMVDTLLRRKNLVVEQIQILLAPWVWHAKQLQRYSRHAALHSLFEEKEVPAEDEEEEVGMAARKDWNPVNPCQKASHTTKRVKREDSIPFHVATKEEEEEAWDTAIVAGSPRRRIWKFLFGPSSAASFPTLDTSSSSFSASPILSMAQAISFIYFLFPSHLLLLPQRLSERSGDEAANRHSIPTSLSAASSCCGPNFSTLLDSLWRYPETLLTSLASVSSSSSSPEARVMLSYLWNPSSSSSSALFAHLKAVCSLFTTLLWAMAYVVAYPYHPTLPTSELPDFIRASGNRHPNRFPPHHTKKKKSGPLSTKGDTKDVTREWKGGELEPTSIVEVFFLASSLHGAEKERFLTTFVQRTLLLPPYASPPPPLPTTMPTNPTSRRWHDSSQSLPSPPPGRSSPTSSISSLLDLLLLDSSFRSGGLFQWCYHYVKDYTERLSYRVSNPLDLSFSSSSSDAAGFLLVVSLLSCSFLFTLGRSLIQRASLAPTPPGEEEHDEAGTAREPLPFTSGLVSSIFSPHYPAWHTSSSSSSWWCCILGTEQRLGTAALSTFPFPPPLLPLLPPSSTTPSPFSSVVETQKYDGEKIPNCHPSHGLLHEGSPCSTHLTRSVLPSHHWWAATLALWWDVSSRKTSISSTSCEWWWMVLWDRVHLVYTSCVVQHLQHYCGPFQLEGRVETSGATGQMVRGHLHRPTETPPALSGWNNKGGATVRSRGHPHREEENVNGDVVEMQLDVPLPLLPSSSSYWWCAVKEVDDGHDGHRVDPCGSVCHDTPPIVSVVVPSSASAFRLSFLMVVLHCSAMLTSFHRAVSLFASRLSEVTMMLSCSSVSRGRKGRLATTTTTSTPPPVGQGMEESMKHDTRETCGHALLACGVEYLLAVATTAPLFLVGPPLAPSPTSIPYHEEMLDSKHETPPTQRRQRGRGGGEGSGQEEPPEAHVSPISFSTFLSSSLTHCQHLLHHVRHSHSQFLLLILQAGVAFGTSCVRQWQARVRSLSPQLSRQEFLSHTNTTNGVEQEGCEVPHAFSFSSSTSYAGWNTFLRSLTTFFRAWKPFPLPPSTELAPPPLYPVHGARWRSSPLAAPLALPPSTSPSFFTSVSITLGQLVSVAMEIGMWWQVEQDVRSTFMGHVTEVQKNECPMGVEVEYQGSISPPTAEDGTDYRHAILLPFLRSLLHPSTLPPLAASTSWWWEVVGNPTFAFISSTATPPPQSGGGSLGPAPPRPCHKTRKQEADNAVENFEWDWRRREMVFCIWSIALGCCRTAGMPFSLLWNGDSTCDTPPERRRPLPNAAAAEEEIELQWEPTRIHPEVRQGSRPRVIPLGYGTTSTSPSLPPSSWSSSSSWSSTVRAIFVEAARWVWEAGDLVEQKGFHQWRAAVSPLHTEGWSSGWFLPNRARVLHRLRRAAFSLLSLVVECTLETVHRGFALLEDEEVTSGTTRMEAQRERVKTKRNGEDPTDASSWTTFRKGKTRWVGKKRPLSRQEEEDEEEEDGESHLSVLPAPASSWWDYYHSLVACDAILSLLLPSSSSSSPVSSTPSPASMLVLFDRIGLQWLRLCDAFSHQALLEIRTHAAQEGTAVPVESSLASDIVCALHRLLVLGFTGVVTSSNDTSTAPSPLEETAYDTEGEDEGVEEEEEDEDEKDNHNDDDDEEEGEAASLVSLLGLFRPFSTVPGMPVFTWRVASKDASLPTWSLEHSFTMRKTAASTATATATPFLYILLVSFTQRLLLEESHSTTSFVSSSLVMELYPLLMEVVPLLAFFREHLSLTSREERWTSTTTLNEEEGGGRISEEEESSGMEGKEEDISLWYFTQCLLPILELLCDRYVILSPFRRVFGSTLVSVMSSSLQDVTEGKEEKETSRHLNVHPTDEEEEKVEQEVHLLLLTLCTLAEVIPPSPSRFSLPVSFSSLSTLPPFYLLRCRRVEDVSSSGERGDAISWPPSSSSSLMARLTTVVHHVLTHSVQSMAFVTSTTLERRKEKTRAAPWKYSCEPSTVSSSSPLVFSIPEAALDLYSILTTRWIFMPDLFLFPTFPLSSSSSSSAEEEDGAKKKRKAKGKGRLLSEEENPYIQAMWESVRTFLSFPVSSVGSTSPVLLPAAPVISHSPPLPPPLSSIAYLCMDVLQHAVAFGYEDRSWKTNDDDDNDDEESIPPRRIPSHDDPMRRETTIPTKDAMVASDLPTHSLRRACYSVLYDTLCVEAFCHSSSSSSGGGGDGGVPRDENVSHALASRVMALASYDIHRWLHLHNPSSTSPLESKTPFPFDACSEKNSPDGEGKVEVEVVETMEEDHRDTKKMPCDIACSSSSFSSSLSSSPSSSDLFRCSLASLFPSPPSSHFVVLSHSLLCIAQALYGLLRQDTIPNVLGQDVFYGGISSDHGRRQVHLHEKDTKRRNNEVTPPPTTPTRTLLKTCASLYVSLLSFYQTACTSTGMPLTLFLNLSHALTAIAATLAWWGEGAEEAADDGRTQRGGAPPRLRVVASEGKGLWSTRDPCASTMETWCKTSMACCIPSFPRPHEAQHHEKGEKPPSWSSSSVFPSPSTADPHHHPLECFFSLLSCEPGGEKPDAHVLDTQEFSTFPSSPPGRCPTTTTATERRRRCTSSSLAWPLWEVIQAWVAHLSEEEVVGAPAGIWVDDAREEEEKRHQRGEAMGHTSSPSCLPEASWIHALPEWYPILFDLGVLFSSRVQWWYRHVDHAPDSEAATHVVHRGPSSFSRTLYALLCDTFPVSTFFLPLFTLLHRVAHTVASSHATALRRVWQLVIQLLVDGDLRHAGGLPKSRATGGGGGDKEKGRSNGSRHRIPFPRRLVVLLHALLEEKIS